MVEGGIVTGTPRRGRRRRHGIVGYRLERLSLVDRIVGGDDGFRGRSHRHLFHIFKLAGGLTLTG